MLGGGGVLGQAFHAGVLAALADAGWDPRRAGVILGTSAGSQVGALLRAGLDAADLAAGLVGDEVSPAGAAILAPVRAAGRLAAQVPAPGGWPRPAAPGLLPRLLARPWTARPGLVLAAALPAGRRDTSGFVAGLEPLFGSEWSTEPLWIPAIRLRDGARVVFGKPGSPPASVGEAVAASCAVPGFFSPVVVDGVRYVDGGCGSATNLDVLAGAAVDVVLVSSPLSLDRVGPRRGVGLPARLMHRAEVAAETARVRRSGATVVAFEPDPAVQIAFGRRSMDYARVPDVVETARRSGKPVAARLVAMGL